MVPLASSVTLTCWVHIIVALLSWLLSTAITTFSCQCPLSNYTPISCHTLKCSWAQTLPRGIMCCTFGNIGPADCGLSFNHISYIACTCYLFQFSVFLLHSAGICLISLDSQGNVSYSPVTCISILLIHSPCINLLLPYSFKNALGLACVCRMPSFWGEGHCFHLFGLILIQPSAAIPVVGFIFGWVLSSLLPMLKTCSSFYTVFRYFAIMIISASLCRFHLKQASSSFVPLHI